MGVEKERKKKGTKRKKLMWQIHLGTVRVSTVVLCLPHWWILCTIQNR